LATWFLHTLCIFFLFLFLHHGGRGATNFVRRRQLPATWCPQHGGGCLSS
jgi:hypothetical protein